MREMALQMVKDASQFWVFIRFLYHGFKKCFLFLPTCQADVRIYYCSHGQDIFPEKGQAPCHLASWLCGLPAPAPPDWSQWLSSRTPHVPSRKFHLFVPHDKIYPSATVSRLGKYYALKCRHFSIRANVRGTHGTCMHTDPAHCITKNCR